MYSKYYDNQVGGGVTVHQRQYNTYNQRGHGVGGFLKGLYRSVYPILQRVARPVGEELWQAGVSVLDDVLTHKSDFKKSLETRLKESGHRLKRKAVDNLETLWNNRGGGSISNSYKKKRRRKNIQKGSGMDKQKSMAKKKRNQKGSGRPRVKKQKPRSKVQKGSGKKKKKNSKKNIKKRLIKKKKNKRNVYDIFS